MKTFYTSPLAEEFVLAQESIICASDMGNEPFGKFPGGAFDD